MPIQYTAYPEYNLAIFIYEGEILVDDIIEAFLTFFNSAEFTPSVNILVDESRCELKDAYFKDMQRLVYRLEDFITARSAQAHTALYSPKDTSFGMGRMYQALTEVRAKRELDIFRTREEALRFVGVDPGDLDLVRKIWPVAADDASTETDEHSA